MARSLADRIKRQNLLQRPVAAQQGPAALQRITRVNGNADKGNR